MQAVNWNQFSEEFSRNLQKVIPFEGLVAFNIDSETTASQYLFKGISNQAVDEYLGYKQHHDPVHFRHSYQKKDIKLSVLQQATSNPEYEDFRKKWNIQDTVELFFRQNGIPVRGMSLVRSSENTAFSQHELRMIESFYDLTACCFNQIYDVSSHQVSVFNEGLTESLTRQESKVLNLLCKGLNNQALADEMHCGLSTIKTHLQHIYQKAQVKSRQELMSRVLCGLQL
ncbi:response regulator transcription factor [Acinetobacter zhairhuonensis]|uniref:response regulator transcription factor n=1 Tax=Acinetobacter sp. A7.4 TaxID=2919921 RepID=UPI001F4F93DF|nr:LuxR C-terminal-related transcriptional regulator [Acinetobacter sp. A7.4]MCJ8162979.1 LuxR C-terminal-related transcriptional regulator [Acinetobacter sp. A7.4]